MNPTDLTSGTHEQVPANSPGGQTAEQLRLISEAVLRSCPVGIVVLNSRGEMVSINPVGLETFDLDRDRIHTTMEGHDATIFLETMPEEEQIRWGNLINLVLTTGMDVSESRYYHRSKYIEKILSLKIAPVRLNPDEGAGVVIVVEDVTEKVTTEQYVIMSEKLVARGEMAALVGHELNNYLSVIANNAELLSMNVGRGQLDKVKFNCKSIIDNVFKIKLFSESLRDSGKPEPEYISYDIRHLIDDLLFSLRAQSRFRLVHFTIDLSEQIPYVEMDVGQIQQVLLNVLANCSDALEERAGHLMEQGREFKREIKISAEYDKGLELVTVKISDNGVGMSAEVLEKIFTLHFTTKRGGRGLGLYNCRLIMNQHGGDMAAESSESKGTTLTLTMPRFQKKKKKLDK